MLFKAGHPIIGFCASGILIRALAPLLSDKRTEPPVVAVSEDGSSIVPLLGGHRGANELARLLAKALGGHAAITTAGDTALGYCTGCAAKGWRLANPETPSRSWPNSCPARPVRYWARADWLKRDKLNHFRGCRTHAGGTDEPVDADTDPACLSPAAVFAVGVGCARGCDPQELIELVEHIGCGSGHRKGRIACVATIDLKADEAAMNALAAHLDAPLRLFPGRNAASAKRRA
jgi:cobalt-precorrin 5A hydrolase/precorrin-3B C17-methyltransferase